MINEPRPHSLVYGVLSQYFSGELQDGVFIDKKRRAYIIDKTVPNQTILELLEKGYSVYDTEREEREDLSLPFPITKQQVHEIYHDLKDIMNPKLYANAKKRYQRLVYPEKKLSKEGISFEERMELTPLELDQVKTLHSQWVEHKMADPNTFRMMFPTGRYRKIAEKVGRVDKLLGILCYWKDRIVAFRAVYIEDQIDPISAYDLAFFSEFWNLPSQSTDYLDFVIMKHLFEYCGVNFLCRGRNVSKGLEDYKKHYPYKKHTIVCYQKKNEEIE